MRGGMSERLRAGYPRPQRANHEEAAKSGEVA
jgi:hypothetical protein